MHSSEVSPDNKAYAKNSGAWYHMSKGERKKAWTALVEYESFRTDHALTSPARSLGPFQGFAVMAWQLGDLVSAENYIRKLEAFDHPTRVLDRSWVHWLKGGVAGAHGNWLDAVAHAEQEIALMTSVGANFFLYFAYLKLAVGLIGLRSFDEAQCAIGTSRSLISGTVQFRSLADVEFTEAWLALNRHDETKFDASVRAAVRVLKDTELHACLWYLDSRVLPQVLDAALTRSIEGDYVGFMISQLALPPPATASPQWPWPVKIRALGDFEILRAGAALESSRKSAKKPLTLLKALLCAHGESIATTQLADWLWPESEADAAQKSLEMALHRLRNLLGDPDLIKLSDGRLYLNRSLVWVDAWEFSDHAKDPHSNIEEVVPLYQGTFLPHDHDAAWAVSYRERLHDTFNRLIGKHGAELESEGEHDRALSWYLKGLDADDMAESFYQGLMRCLLRLGRRAEALSTYQRLRRILSLKLKTVPSSESTALAQMAEARSQEVSR